MKIDAQKRYALLLIATAMLAAYFIVEQPFATVPTVEYKQISAVSECGDWNYKFIKSYRGNSGYRNYCYRFYYGVDPGSGYHCFTTRSRDNTKEFSAIDPRDNKTYYLKAVFTGAPFKLYCDVECLPTMIEFGNCSITTAGMASVPLHIDPGFEQGIDRINTKIICFDGITWQDMSNQIDPTMDTQDITIRWQVKEDMHGTCKAVIANDCGYTGDWNESSTIFYILPTPPPEPTPTPTPDEPDEPDEPDDTRLIWVGAAVLLLSLILLRLRA